MHTAAPSLQKENKKHLGKAELACSGAAGTQQYPTSIPACSSKDANQHPGTLGSRSCTLQRPLHHYSSCSCSVLPPLGSSHLSPAVSQNLPGKGSTAPSFLAPTAALNQRSEARGCLSRHVTEALLVGAVWNYRGCSSGIILCQIGQQPHHRARRSHRHRLPAPCCVPGAALRARLASSQSRLKLNMMRHKAFLHSDLRSKPLLAISNFTVHLLLTESVRLPENTRGKPGRA